MKDILEVQLNNDSISHAYIFESKDTEKNLVRAREFAEKIFQKNNVFTKLQFNDDYKEIIDYNNVITIDQIRQMIKDVYMKSYNGKVKIYVIHNCQNLRKESSNAMLKVLEEPSKLSIIILTTNNSFNLLSTIRSRCQIVKFDDEVVKNNIDRSKLSSIIVSIMKSNLADYFKNRDFFDNYKEAKEDLIDTITDFFGDLLIYKYTKDAESLKYDLWISDIKKVSDMSFDRIEEIINMLHEIREGFKFNVGYQLSIEHFLFSIWGIEA